MRRVPTRTCGLLCDVLPVDLARLVESWIWPATSDFQATVDAGHYELFTTRQMASNTALQYACMYGEDAFIDWTIAHGATWWDWGLIGACVGENANAAHRMLALGAPLCTICQRPVVCNGQFDGKPMSHKNMYDCAGRPPLPAGTLVDGPLKK